MKYTAFGEIREMNGSSPTDYESKRSFDFKANAKRIRSYTGQRKEVEFGLSYYNSRWYDASLAHFISADTLIPQPGDSGNWDRYAYVLNNPLKYIDPSGFIPQIEGDDPITHWANQRAHEKAGEIYFAHSKPEYSLITNPEKPRTVEDLMLYSMISRNTIETDEHPIFKVGVGVAGSAQFGVEVETGLLFDFHEMEYGSYITHSEWGSALAVGGEAFVSVGSFIGSSVKDAGRTSAIVGGQ